MDAVFIHGWGSDHKDELLLDIINSTRHFFRKVFIIDYSKYYEDEDKIDKIIEHVINARIPREHIIIAHSMGCLFAVHKAREDTKGLILLAPSIKIKNETLLRFKLKITGKIKLDESMPELTKEDVKRLEELIFAFPELNIPVLVVLAEKDEIIDNEKTLEFLKSKLPNASFVVLEGESHHFTEKRDELIDIIKEFIKKIR